MLCDFKFWSKECQRKEQKNNCIEKCRWLELDISKLLDTVMGLEVEKKVLMAQYGDKEAREEIISMYREFTRKFAKSLIFKVGNKQLNSEFDIVESEMLITLNLTIDLYNPNKGNNFGTYLKWNIRGDIGNLLKRIFSNVRKVNYQPDNISLDTVVLSEDDDSFSYEDIIGTEELSYEEIEIREFLDNCLEEDERKVLIMLIDGYGVEKIIEISNNDPDYFIRIMSSLKTKVQEYVKQ